MNFYVEVAQRLADDLANCLDRLQDTYLTDATQPLDERWAAYESVSKFLPIDPWVSNNLIRKALGEDISLYDDFYIERYKTVLYANVVESLQENLEYAVEYRGPQEDVEPYYNAEQIDRLRELILASGKQGFIYDW